MEVIIFLGQNININNYDFNNKYIIGVDKGASILAEYNIMMDLAIGDFDSIADDEIDEIKKCSKKIIKLNPIKDETDTKEAIIEALKISNDITILGGIQGYRIEHFIANMFLLKKYPFVRIMDDNSLIFISSKSITINDDYKYISIFPFEDSIISLKGFKYDLTDYNLKRYDDLGVSNELVSENGFIEIKKGQIFIIMSNESIEIE